MTTTENTMAKILQQLEPKTNLWVYNMNDDFPGKHSHALVYSFLLYQAPYQKPTTSLISYKTGLTRPTVTSALLDLKQFGLMNDDNRILTKDLNDQYLYPAKSALGYKYWMCYIRAESSPISLSATSVWSYLVHCKASDFKGRLSVEFIARVLGMNRNTVDASLEELQEHRFLKYTTDPLNFTKFYDSLTNTQLGYFADKGKNKSARKSNKDNGFTVCERTQEEVAAENANTISVIMMEEPRTRQLDELDIQLDDPADKIDLSIGPTHDEVEQFVRSKKDSTVLVRKVWDYVKGHKDWMPMATKAFDVFSASC